MSREKPSEPWREWAPKTTSEAGPEGRGIREYETILGFDRKSLEGKTILDVGSGSLELFSKELNKLGLRARVISLNPDYIHESYRLLSQDEDWQKLSVAAIGQELPFRNDTFDRVFGVESITRYMSPYRNKDAAQKWGLEIGRVLKPGGGGSFRMVVLLWKECRCNKSF